MPTNKILLTGASGLLGRHLTLEADRPSHSELDITGQVEPKNYELIVHAAAYTKVALAETQMAECFKVNVLGTEHLLSAYPNTPFVYISSEYAKNPVNFYSKTKELAEQYVKQHTAPYLIIRTLFKPYPWAYPKAFKDQYTLGGYVTVVAPLIEKQILTWNRKDSGMVYVGDGKGRKTMLELAMETKPDVVPNSIYDIKDVKIPKDYQ